MSVEKFSRAWDRSIFMRDENGIRQARIAYVIFRI